MPDIQMIEGLNRTLSEAKRSTSRKNRRTSTMSHAMEFPPLEDLERDFGPEYFGLGEMFSRENLQAAGTAALAGAGGILISANVLERIAWFMDKPNVKAGAAIALGLAGGFALWNTSPDAAKGLVGGVAGMGIAKLVANLAGIPGALAAAEVVPTPPYQFWSPTRGALRGAGLGRDMVSEEDPFALAAAEVSQDALGSWLGG